MANTTSSSTSSSMDSTSSNTTSSMESHYLLNPSDNPGALITPVMLQGDNYSECATEFWNSLQAKQRISFIDGSIINPELSRWTANNSMIVGWIRTSIDPLVRSTVSHVPDAFKLWESLQRRFSVKNIVRKHMLEDEINNCKQNGQSVLEYYDCLSKLWEELQNFTTSTTCTCSAAAIIDKEREDVHVHKFLFGLDESRFSSIRS